MRPEQYAQQDNMLSGAYAEEKGGHGNIRGNKN
jgi:hypothetical protein